MATPEEVLASYDRRVRERLAIVGVLVVLLCVLVTYALVTGPISISLDTLGAVLLGADAGVASRVVWNIRLPRIVAALGAGFGLAVAGAVLQSLLRNPLASPYTLGISQAAAFGAALAIVGLGAGTTGANDSAGTIPYLVTLAAFGTAVASTLALLAVARIRRATTETLILTGIALGAFFTAGTSTLEYFATNIQLAALVAWKFGSITGSTWEGNAALWLVALAGGVYFLRRAWAYEVLDAGDDTARSLGIRVDRLRLVGMVAASLLTAVVVSLFGVIGFVGLVVPHIVRRLIGGDERFLVGASSVGGAALLLTADIVARSVLAPVVLPVGIVTSFVGVPLFVYLIVYGREQW